MLDIWTSRYILFFKEHLRPNLVTYYKIGDYITKTVLLKLSVFVSILCLVRPRKMCKTNIKLQNAKRKIYMKMGIVL